jgi:hypothetical protein
MNSEDKKVQEAKMIKVALENFNPVGIQQLASLEARAFKIRFDEYTKVGFSEESAIKLIIGRA